MGKNMALNYDSRFLPRYPDRKNQRVYYTRTVAPTIEPVTIDEAIRHLQVSRRNDDAYIAGLIRLAREYVENFTGQVMMTSTWVAVCELWPTDGKFELTPTPVSAISSVKYYANGETALTTVDAANYVFSSLVRPVAVTLGDDFTFPELATRPDAVQVTFTAGVSNPANVPQMLRHAVLILIRHFYDNPSAISVASANELPMHLQSLINSQRVAGWVA